MTDEPEVGDVAPTTHARAGRGRLLWIVAVVVVVGTAFVAYWFQPQKLLIDERVHDAAPSATGSSATAGPDASEPPAQGPIDVARGAFISRDHTTTGTVRVLEGSDGTRILRIEALETDNGPDLFVYLSTNTASGPEGAFDDDVVNLGRLRGNKGDQNYDVPTDVDLDRYASVVIWCDRFNAAFGAADLEEA